MFITLEGIEGSGKSTVIQGLATHFEEQGHEVLCTREPGGSELGKTLRSLLLDSRVEVCPQAELFLFLADRAQHVNSVIVPALAQNKIVLCDRFIHSTIAYQGGGRGLDNATLHTLNIMAVQGLLPHKVLLLDLPLEMGLNRAQARNAASNMNILEGKFDAQSIEFHSKVQQSYREQAAQYPQRFCYIDASQSAEKVLQDCIDVLTSSI